MSIPCSQRCSRPEKNAKRCGNTCPIGLCPKSTDEDNVSKPHPITYSGRVGKAIVDVTSGNTKTPVTYLDVGVDSNALFSFARGRFAEIEGGFSDDTKALYITAPSNGTLNNLYLDISEPTIKHNGDDKFKMGIYTWSGSEWKPSSLTKKARGGIVKISTNGGLSVTRGDRILLGIHVDGSNSNVRISQFSLGGSIEFAPK